MVSTTSSVAAGPALAQWAPTDTANCTNPPGRVQVYAPGVKPIAAIAEQLGISSEHLVPYGHDKAKVLPPAWQGASPRTAKLILVTALTPTPAGEGKTTTSIGLGDALALRGESVCLALREPSLGPCFGIKGGGTGGGESQLSPSDDINLHFTGDFHAITAAHNLLAAVIDNHLHFGSEVGLDPRRIRWPRVLDVNDRALRHVTTGQGGPTMGMPRESSFDITAASELMAILCLATDAEDLRTRIDRIVVGYTRDRKPVRASQLGATGAMLALLRDAIHPNLVQTRYGTPALVHGGPFANIAHGCNSVIATKAALSFADWCVTEAGFGSDLGAEKFFHIKCRSAGLDPDLVVVVASIRALKMHGGVALADLGEANPDAVKAGLPNLAKHLENVAHFGKPAVVAINRRDTDSDDEVAVVRAFGEANDIPIATCDHFAKGPQGAAELADLVVANAGKKSSAFTPLYALDAPVVDKVTAVAQKIYGASKVVFATKAERALKQLSALGCEHLPVCMAKTQSSLSDDPKVPGRPEGFTITVRDLQVNAGAGFIVALTGDMLRMPGLPRAPQAEAIDLRDGVIQNLK